MTNPSRPKKRKRRHQREGNDNEQPSNDDGETKASSEPTDPGTSSASELTNKYDGDGATNNQHSSSPPWTQRQHQHNQQLQQQQQMQSISAIASVEQQNFRAVPTQAPFAPIPNSQTQQQGLVDVTQQGTAALPQSILAAGQPFVPGILPIQENSQLSSSLLVGIQQLLQQLSSNLAQRGLDEAQSNVINSGNASQLGMPWPTSESANNNSGSFEHVSSNAMQAVATAMGNATPFASAAMYSTTTPATTMHPPIHPGAATGDPQGRSQDYTTIPCRARGMPPDHNSQVSSASGQGRWTTVMDEFPLQIVVDSSSTDILLPMFFAHTDADC
jgi:hypothetical protein